MCREFGCLPSQLSARYAGEDGEDAALLLSIMALRRYKQAYELFSESDNPDMLDNDGIMRMVKRNDRLVSDG